MAEFLLYGRTEYSEVLEFAASLREAGERTDSARAVAFAATVAGEAHLLSGDLDRALVELKEGVELHHRIGANAGEALSLQRLAEVHLELGETEEALRLLDSALPLARWSALSHHLVQRIFGTMIRASGDIEDARRHLAMAERSAEAWEGTAWAGAVAEARAHIATAQGNDSEATTLLAAATDLFERAGQPLDARRCRTGLSA